jgi:hypothetical protein
MHSPTDKLHIHLPALLIKGVRLYPPGNQAIKGIRRIALFADDLALLVMLDLGLSGDSLKIEKIQLGKNGDMLDEGVPGKE